MRATHAHQVDCNCEMTVRLDVLIRVIAMKINAISKSEASEIGDNTTLCVVIISALAERMRDKSVAEYSHHGAYEHQQYRLNLLALNLYK